MKKITILLSMILLLLLVSCGSAEQVMEEVEETTTENSYVNTYALQQELTNLVDGFPSATASPAVDFILVSETEEGFRISVGLFFHTQAEVLPEFHVTKTLIRNYMLDAGYPVSHFSVAMKHSNYGNSKDTIISWDSSDMITGSYMNSDENLYISKCTLEGLLGKEEATDITEQTETAPMEESSVEEFVKNETDTLKTSTDNTTTIVKQIAESDSESVVLVPESTPLTKDETNSEIPASESIAPAPNNSADNATVAQVPDVSTTETNPFDAYDNAEQQNTKSEYVLNTDTQKIHHPGCSSVPKIAPQNYATSNTNVDSLEAQGYSVCGRCFK